MSAGGACDVMGELTMDLTGQCQCPEKGTDTDTALNFFYAVAGLFLTASSLYMRTPNAIPPISGVAYKMLGSLMML